jgi:hypothetical protein
VPFRSDSDSALSIAMKHLSETLPTLPPEYSVFQPIIDRLTAKERAERFATATEVLAALRSLNSGQGARVRTLIGSSRDATRETKTMPRAATPRPMPPGLPATAANARKPWLIGAGAGVFGAAIALAFFIAQREPTVEPATTAQQASVPTAPVSDANASTNIVSATLAPTVDEAPVEVVTTPTQNLQPVATMAAVAAPARPRETAAAQRARKIAGLLEQAEQDFSAGALTTPANENAADRYREVLALDADNAQAQAGLRRIGASLVDEVDRARRANELDTAQAALDQARSVQPDHPRLAKLQADIGERRVTLDKRSRKAREKASEHLSRAEQLLARSPLVVKVVADAHDHYDEAAQLTPEDPALDQMKQRIVFGYVVAAQYELNRNEPRRALNVVNYARRRNVATPELETIERTASAVQQQ